jgi:hypothetical protein
MAFRDRAFWDKINLFKYQYAILECLNKKLAGTVQISTGKVK